MMGVGNLQRKNDSKNSPKFSPFDRGAHGPIFFGGGQGPLKRLVVILCRVLRGAGELCSGREEEDSSAATGANGTSVHAAFGVSVRGSSLRWKSTHTLLSPFYTNYLPNPPF